MNTRATGWVRSTAALVVLVAGVFGVPLVLVAVAGWPLPTEVPSFDRIRTALQQGDIPADVVLKTLAVIAWVIWLQFVWAVVWEVAVNVRRVDRSQRPLSVPVVPRVVGAGVGRLVAVAFSIGTVTLNSASVAVALPGTPSSVFAPAVAEPSRAPIADSQRTDSEVCWAVSEGDTLWHIAQTSLGDGSRAGDILELNPLLRSPRDVRPGQQLRLPADGVVPPDRRPETAVFAGATDGSVERAGYLAPAQVVIEPGDTLWDLSEERLDGAMVDPVRPSEVVGYLDQVIEANADVIEDPNLIFPGEVFEMPAVGTPPAPPAPPLRTPSLPVADEMATPLPQIESEVGDAAETKPSFDQPQRSTPTVSAPDRATTPARPSRNALSDRDLVPMPIGDSDHSSQANAAPWLAGISGATVLSSAILVAYRRRRRRQAARGAGAYRRATHESTTVDSLVAAADVNLVTWAACELGVVFDGLHPSDFVGVPLAAEISETCGVELLWSHRNPSAPSPWEAIDGGWSWRLAYDPDRPAAVDAPPHPLPALVTVGTRDGNQLLLNLEAFGSVAVTGDHVAAEGLVRAMAVELGSNDLSANSFVHTVGFETETDVHFERLTRRSELDAFEHARSMVASHDAVLVDADLESTFALRVGGDAAGRESTVIVADASQLTDPTGFVESIRPGRGVALIVLGELASVGATIHVTADGTANIDQLDLEFKAAHLPRETVEALSDLLDEAIEPIAVDPIDSGIAGNLTDIDAQSLSADPAEVADLASSDLLDIEAGADPECERPEVLVRVLGPPTVDGFAQLGRVETNIVTFLAVKEGSATKDQLVHAVWGGRLVSDQTLFNRVAKTRAVLGEYLPARTRGSVTIDLDRRVGTDLAVLVGALQNSVALSAAQAIASLTAALDLVRGVPFDGADFEWAHEQQFVADACDTVEAATLRVVTLALELGDPASARQAISQGLRALPGNEPIYRARMQIEHALGNVDGVNGALRELTSVLRGAADDGFEFEPSTETIDLHRRLSVSGQRG